MKKRRMEELKTLRRKIEAKVFILACPVFFIGLAFLGIKFSFGFLAGALMSILNFRLLAKTVIRLSTLKKTSGVFFIGSYSLRYILMGLVLWIAINKSLLCFLGASIGLFMVKAAIYWMEFIPSKRGSLKTPTIYRKGQSISWYRYLAQGE